MLLVFPFLRVSWVIKRLSSEVVSLSMEGKLVFLGPAGNNTNFNPAAVPWLLEDVSRTWEVETSTKAQQATVILNQGNVSVSG